MHRELHIRSAGLHANLAHDANRRVAHHLVFAIGQRLRRGHGDGIAGVDAHRVHVLDRADDDDVVGEVAHHLQLVLLPAQHRLFDQALVDGRKIEPARQDLHQLFAVVGDAAAGAAQRERWADHHRETDLRGEIQAIAHDCSPARTRHVQPDLLHRVFEEQPVFGLLDGVELRADQLHVVLFENAGIGQIDGEIQSSLAADRRQQRELPLRLPSMPVIIAASRRMISSTYSRVSGSI